MRVHSNLLGYPVPRRPQAVADTGLYALSPEKLADVPHMPGSLEESLNALERDHEFLTRGDVLTADALEEWLAFKRRKELDPVRMRPAPYEFYLYFDI